VTAALTLIAVPSSSSTTSSSSFAAAVAVRYLGELTDYMQRIAASAAFPELRIFAYPALQMLVKASA
jgi:hypothetical protein